MLKRNVNSDFKKFLSFGFVPQDETAIRYITNLESSVKEAKSLELEFGEALNAVIESVNRDLLSVDSSSKFSLGVTAGLDSRLLLEILSDKATKELYTFGIPGMLDFDFIKVLSDESGLPITFLNTADSKWESSLFFDFSDKFQDLPLSPRVFGYQRALQLNIPDLHGYLNDALTGSHLPNDAPHLSWDDSINLFCKKNNPFDFQKYVVGLTRALPDRPHIDGGEISYFDQLDFGYRQAQRIRLDPIGSKSNYVYPFENKFWTGYWLNRSFTERYAQSAYIQHLKRMRSPIFFDLEDVTSRFNLKSIQQQIISQHRGPSFDTRNGVYANKNSDGHFCFFTHFNKVSSFENLCHELLTSLKNRNIFEIEFIDSVLSNISSGDIWASKRLNGLLATEIAIIKGTIFV